MGLTVIQLVPSLNAGGVERGVVEVSQALVQAGHRSIIVSSGGRLVEEIQAHGAQHVAMPIHRKSLMTLRCVRPLCRLMLESGAHVLHARSRVPAWVAHFALRRMPNQRPAFVTSVHGLHSVNRYSKIMTSGQVVEVVSETVRQYVLNNYPSTSPDKLVLNYRGVDPEWFPYGYQPPAQWIDSFESQYPQLKGRFVISLVGRITRLKGHHDLINAIAKLRERGIDAHGLVVGGEDPRRLAYAQELRGAVKSKGLNEHVTFTGHRSDVRELIAYSGAVVSLSTKPESFGRAALEAIRLGRPVVGYDHGGVGEVLAEVYPAGLAPLGNIGQLTSLLGAIATGQSPAPDPTDRFLLRAMLDRTLMLYQDAAEQYY